ncbi:MAG TPA: homoserine O-succinyltransferase, partial [Arenibaculum sp.]|nr:homoserine O-succinyltransferase [Arenibaculum sp.]
MPIKIPDNSPAELILKDEGVDIIRDRVALRQDIRPLRILLLNLMPTKVNTEVQIARLLSHTPLQVELSLLTTASYRPTNTSAEYLQAFYRTLDEVRSRRFDAMVVTGAPVERLDFEEVDYWQELLEIFDWAKTNVFRRFHICWGAQAALHAEYAIDKEPLPEKLFGVYEQIVREPRAKLLRGFPDRFPTPVSRYTSVSRAAVEAQPDLRILVDSHETGVCLMDNVSRGDVYILNHVEYDAETLRDEYMRDLIREPGIRAPLNYFENDDPEGAPRNAWRPFGYLLFSNWIYMLYEDTPY